MSDSETISVELGGAKLLLPQEIVLRALFTKLGIRHSAMPKIGELWHGHGGIFIGLGRDENGRCHHLIAAAEEFSGAVWEKQNERAIALNIDGFTDFTLPFRRDQSLQFANVPESFKQEWYWSKEQSASGSTYAWAQHFYYGTQNVYLKFIEFRARAVRREFIE